MRDVFLSYQDQAGAEQVVLDIEQFAIPAGKTVGITGPSGSGKTSLLYVIAGIEQPGRGRIAWDDVNIDAMAPHRRDRWRRNTVGFVFQDFHLFDGMSALQNVMVPLHFGGHGASAAILKQRAADLLNHVGIGYPYRRVERLSRGERQRVAIARALLLSPSIILADEPTASLDARSGHDVGELLIGLSRDAGATVVVVSHDAALLAMLDVVHHLDGGRLSSAAA